MPAVMPQNVPVVLIVPTAGLLLLHAPPVPPVYVAHWPAQMLVAPVITGGTAFTVAIA